MVEGLSRAYGEYVDFCLLKGAEGDPYISWVELGSLSNGSKYMNGYEPADTVLKLVSMINRGAGNTVQDIRYD